MRIIVENRVNDAADGAPGFTRALGRFFDREELGPRGGGDFAGERTPENSGWKGTRHRAGQPTVARCRHHFGRVSESLSMATRAVSTGIPGELAGGCRKVVTRFHRYGAESCSLVPSRYHG